MAIGDPIPAPDWADVKRSSKDAPFGRLVQAAAVSTTLAHNTLVAIPFATETGGVDSDGQHDNVTTNSRVTPNLPGWYEVSGGVAFTGQTDYTSLEVNISKNGTGQAPANCERVAFASGTQVRTVGPILVDCNGSSDYFEIYARHTRTGSGSSSTVVSSQFASVLQWKFLREL